MCMYSAYALLRSHGMNGINTYTPQVWHRAEELPASARMLTLLALYHDYAGGDDGGKARAMSIVSELISCNCVSHWNLRCSPCT